VVEALEAEQAEVGEADAPRDRRGGAHAEGPVAADPETDHDATLRRRLAALALDPAAFDRTSGAAAVREAAGQGAVSLRVVLLAAAADLRAPSWTTALEQLAQRLTGSLAVPVLVRNEALAAAREALGAALQNLGATPLAPAADPLAGIGRPQLDELATLVLRELARVLGARSAGGQSLVRGRAALAAALEQVAPEALAARLGGPVLGALLALPAEAPLRATLVARALAAVHPSTDDSRLALLADASSEATPVERALASLGGALESEAVANATRRDAGEATAWTVPVHDGARWSTMTLLEDPPGRDDDAEGRSRSAGGGTRITLGTEFSGLGPVRADLSVTPERVVLRFVVADPKTAQMMRAALHELREGLATGDRQVLVALAEGRPEDARVELPMPRMDHLDLRG